MCLQIKRLRAEGEDLCHLAFGQSPFSIPGPMVEALRENAHRNEYLPVQGDFFLFERNRDSQNFCKNLCLVLHEHAYAFSQSPPPDIPFLPSPLRRHPSYLPEISPPLPPSKAGRRKGGWLRGKTTLTPTPPLQIALYLAPAPFCPPVPPII